jgi:hypothetical protein
MSEHHLNKRVTKLEEKVSHLENVHTPRQEDETGVGPQDTTEKKSDPAPRQPTPIRDIPPAPKDSPKAKYPWYKTLEGWYYLLGIVGIPFAIGYAVVTYFQWHDLRNNFVKDERPYVMIGGAFQNQDSAIAEGRVPCWNIAFSNYGKSPALRTIIYAGLMIGDSFTVIRTVDSFFSAIKMPLKGVGPGVVLPPGGPPSPPTEFPPKYVGEWRDAVVGQGYGTACAERAVTKEEAAMILSGRFRIGVYGRNEYHDTVGNDYWTDFCLLSVLNTTGSTTMMWCSAHNDLH